MVGLTFVSALPPLWQSVWNELFVEFPTCLELGSLSARSTLFPTNLEGHPSTVSGRKFPWRCVCVFCFPKKTSVEAQKTCKYMYVYTYAYVCIYVYYVAEVKKGRCTSKQQNDVFFLKKRFNLEDLVVSKRCFFFGWVDVLTFVAR